MAARDGPVWASLRESRKGIQWILFPCPAHDRPEVFAGLVRRATGIRAALSDGTLVHPVEKLPDLLATDLFEGHPIASRRTTPPFSFAGRGTPGDEAAANDNSSCMSTFGPKSRSGSERHVDRLGKAALVDPFAGVNRRFRTSSVASRVFR